MRQRDPARRLPYGAQRRVARRNRAWPRAIDAHTDAALRPAGRARGRRGFSRVRVRPVRYGTFARGGRRLLSERRESITALEPGEGLLCLLGFGVQLQRGPILLASEIFLALFLVDRAETVVNVGRRWSSLWSRISEVRLE